jgi:uncharacterized protein (DUF2345 family)
LRHERKTNCRKASRSAHETTSTLTLTSPEVISAGSGCMSATFSRSHFAAFSLDSSAISSVENMLMVAIVPLPPSTA